MTVGQVMDGIHRGGTVLTAGAALPDARAILVLLHGRGADAQDILGLAGELVTPDIASFAPQATGNTWYPYSFLSPIERNEPYLSSALGAVGDLLAWLEQNGVPAERIVLGGFSQGACLALEFAARNARRYGALLGFSGGLIGPDGAPRGYAGSLSGTPVFLGCSDVDMHIPRRRVEESATVLDALGADVTARLYQGMGHTINDDEITRAREILASIAR
jgi:predicted esterase